MKKRNERTLVTLLKKFQSLQKEKKTDESLAEKLEQSI